jgi:uncharacterized membrane protein
MMTIRKRSGIGRALVPVLVALQTFAGYVVAVAQQAEVKIDVGTHSSGGAAWYQTWWVWVLVGLFAIIVIVAITSRGRAARD